MSSADIAVIGSGLAGAAFAARVGGTAGSSARVVLIERETGPHDKVCGEFLSHEALLHLHELGIDPIRLGGHPIGRVRLVCGRQVAESALPFEGVGLSRRVLDEALLQRAAAAGATILRGRRVQALGSDGAGHRLRLEGGDSLLAGEAVLATGKHELRGWRRGAGWQNDLVGFKLHLRLDPAQRRALEHHVELTLFRGGYAGLQLVADDVATLCLLVRRARLATLGDCASVIAAAGAEAPLLARRLADAVPLQARPLSVAGIPYGLVGGVGDRDRSAVWRLGDQAAVIPSFTGDGMSIALHSAARGAALWSAGERPAALQAELRRDVGWQVRRAALMSLGAVRRPIQAAAVQAVRRLPVLAEWTAAATRIPDAVLRRGLEDERST